MYSFQVIDLTLGQETGLFQDVPGGPHVISCVDGEVTVRSSVVENSRILLKRQFYILKPDEEVSIEGNVSSSKVQLYINAE